MKLLGNPHKYPFLTRKSVFDEEIESIILTSIHLVSIHLISILIITLLFYLWKFECCRYFFKNKKYTSEADV